MLCLLIINQVLLQALRNTSGYSLWLDHDEVALQLANTFLCSYQIKGGPYVNHRQGDLLLLEGLLDLLLNLHTPPCLELDGWPIREELVTHLFEL